MVITVNGVDINDYKKLTFNVTSVTNSYNDLASTKWDEVSIGAASSGNYANLVIEKVPVVGRNIIDISSLTRSYKFAFHLNTITIRQFQLLLIQFI